MPLQVLLRVNSYLSSLTCNILKSFHGLLWKDFLKKFTDLYETQIKPAINEGLSAGVYTQLSDVQDELNGLMTYDRKQVKAHPDKIKEIMKDLNIID